MAPQLPPAPRSPGHLRRKPPSLPASAFSPPNSGTSDRFPLPPSPSTVYPESVIDAHVIADPAHAAKAERVVLAVAAAHDLHPLPSVLSFLVPFDLASPTLPALPSSPTPLALTTVYTTPAPTAAAALHAALALPTVRAVDVDVQTDVIADDARWEAFEDILTKASADLPKQTPLVLSNILPPPHSLDLPIVKLMNHPTYRAYQAHTAALSLFPSLYVKLRPPAWDAPTPANEGDGKEKKEWKRRIKMYLGPVLEAFGFQRIIFGSAPPAGSSAASNAADWYELARESLAELSVEQEAIDAVFAGNARRVYGAAPPAS